MSKIEMPFVDDAKEGNLAATRRLWAHLADRLDALDPHERELLRMALRNLGAGVPAPKAFMPVSKRGRGIKQGRPRTAGVSYHAMHAYYIERIDVGDDPAEAKKQVMAKFACSKRTAQRAVKAVDEA